MPLLIQQLTNGRPRAKNKKKTRIKTNLKKQLRKKFTCLESLLSEIIQLSNQNKHYLIIIIFITLFLFVFARRGFDLFVSVASRRLGRFTAIQLLN